MLKIGMEKLLRILDWINKYLTPICAALATAVGAALQYNLASYIVTHYPNWNGLARFLETYLPISLIVFLVLSIIFSSLRIFTQKSISSLEGELLKEREKTSLIAENVEALFNGLLLNLSSHLQFSKGEHSRITIYIHNKNAKFISFGRYSPNPSYAGKGRSLLPDNEGCIAHAWQNDWCFESSLGYKDSRQKYKISRNGYQNIRMKSVCFAVKRIDAQNSQPLAVLVVESCTENRFHEDDIKAVLSKEEAYLAPIIYGLRAHIPGPQEAKERGF